MDARKFAALGIALIFLITPVVMLRLSNVLGPITPLQTTPIRVACVGDSITQITKYTADLQAELGSNYTVGNFGVSGSTVSLSTARTTGATIICAIRSPRFTAKAASP